MYLVDGPEFGLHVIRLPNGVGDAATEAFAPSKDVAAIAAGADGVYWGGRVQNEGTLRWCPHAGCKGAPVIKASSAIRFLSSQTRPRSTEVPAMARS